MCVCACVCECACVRVRVQYACLHEIKPLSVSGLCKALCSYKPTTIITASLTVVCLSFAIRNVL